MNTKYKTFEILEEQMELMQTPKETASEIITYCSRQIPFTDTVLEPFKGHGNIYRQILNHKKYWCKDFFQWTQKVDWIITNPPFQIKKDGKVLNAFIIIVERCMELCNKGFFLLINHKLWSSLTVKRLNDWESKGWFISRIKIFEIKKWYGRYYLVKFEKNGVPIIDK